MERRLHIAWVADSWQGDAGGVATGRRFVAALRQRHDVTVIAGAPGEARGVALRAFHLPLVARRMRENGFAFAVPRRRALEQVFSRADVVHVQFPFWLGVRSVAVARALGVPVVSAFHVQPENLLYNVGLRSPRLVETAYRFLLRHVLEPSDAVVCPSPFALELLRARGLGAPAEVISNGAPPGMGPAPDRPLPSAAGVMLVLVAGRLAPEKRVDVVIEAVRRSRHGARIQLVITGRGPAEAELRRLAATLPLPARMGFVDDRELMRLFQTADVLVHASEVELEGMAVLEALTCGTPALVARAPASAAPQFAVADEFLFAPGDPVDLARRLDALAEAPERLVAARRLCLARAEGYRFEDSLARLEALYARLVARAVTPRGAAATRSTAPRGAQ